MMAIAVREDFSVGSPGSPDGTPTFPLAFFPGVPASPTLNTSGTTANALITLNLPAVAGKMAYVTGFEVMAFGATAASIIQVSLSGILGSGSSSLYYLSVPAGVTTPCSPFPLAVQFTVPIQASAINSAITLSVPALGAGNTNTMANIRGFYV